MYIYIVMCFYTFSITSTNIQYYASHYYIIQNLFNSVIPINLLQH